MLLSDHADRSPVRLTGIVPWSPVSVMMETNPHKWLTCLDESNPMVQSQCLCGGRDDGRERNSLWKAVVMGLLSLVEQPARYDSGMIALQKIKRPVGHLCLA